MVDNKILNRILLTLADQFEEGRHDRGVTLTVTVDEYEPFRETMAALRAEGSVSMAPFKTYRLTESGYAKYVNKIRALRVLG